MLSLGYSVKSLLLLVVVVAEWSSGFARSTAAEHHGWVRQAARHVSLTLLLLPAAAAAAAAASSVGIHGGFGERQPGLEYDTEDPLFDLNVLITGVQSAEEGSSVRYLVLRVACSHAVYERTVLSTDMCVCGEATR